MTTKSAHQGGDARTYSETTQNPTVALPDPCGRIGRTAPARASVDKLKLHRIDQSISTAVIKFEKEESVEFGTWAELESYDFKVPYVTQEVMLRWDFLLQLNST